LNTGLIAVPVINTFSSVAVYNSLPNERIEVISLHVTSPKIKVADGDVNVNAQIEPILQPSDGTVDKELFQVSYSKKQCCISNLLFFNCS
jgi:hypothetical protein